MSVQPIIIHQMAKVGSTAIQLSLQQQSLPALQTHHLGQANLMGMLHEYLDPLTSMERVKHELTLFTDQIIASKLISLSQHQKLAEPVRLITLAREPVERWFSSLIQNYAFHLSTAKLFYSLEKLQPPGTDWQCFDFAIEKILSILTDSPYCLGSNEFADYLKTEPFTLSAESGQQLKLLGDELLTPFYWFQKNGALLDIDFFAGSPMENYQSYRTPHIQVLLLKFEFLKNAPEESEQVIRNFLNLETFKLCQANVSKEKSGYEVIKRIKSKYYRQFTQLHAIEQSLYCQHFGYSALSQYQP